MFYNIFLYLCIVISVILPSYLGAYNRAATNRNTKLIRAIESVVHQTYTDWELIIVADGCEKTVDIMTTYMLDCEPQYAAKMRGFFIQKQRSWAGRPRNTGIEKAKGDIICYLDSDDYLGETHLQFIADSFKQGIDWIWFDDMQVNGGIFKPSKCSVRHYGQCGTANIAHRRELPVRWPTAAHYSQDDWGFIRSLRTHAGAYAGQGYYHVCHIPNKYDI